jgi:hypothetical protein
MLLPLTLVIPTKAQGQAQLKEEIQKFQAI